jgi:hypothetical protein
METLTLDVVVISALIGIFSSLVAAVLYTMAAFAISDHFKKQIQIGINRILGTGVSYIYKNEAEAAHDIRSSFEKTECSSILTLRGNSFLDEDGALSFIFTERNGSQTVRYCMADVSSDSPDAFVKHRANELQAINDQPAEEFLLDVERQQKVALRKSLQDCKIEVRFHNSPAAFRLLIFDGDLYILYYSGTSRAIKNRVYRCSAHSELHKAFTRYFDLVWGASKRQDREAPN